MISWDIVMMLGQGFLTLFLLPTALAFDIGVDRSGIFLRHKEGVYVPRLTSGSTAIGLSVITLALFNLGAPIGGVACAFCVMLWGVVFVFRGTAPTQSLEQVVSKHNAGSETSLEDLLLREGGTE